MSAAEHSKPAAAQPSADPVVMRGEDYAPISDYAVIGNCRTVALVSRRGSIDWLCMPHFSGPSLFAALLDARRGGCFTMTPRDVLRIEREYVTDTNVLQTTFHCRGGVLRLTDFMAIFPGDSGAVTVPQHELGRIAECLEGSVTLDALYAPRPGYASVTPHLARRGKLGWTCAHRGLAVNLLSDLPFAPRERGTLAASASLAAGEIRHVSLTFCESDALVIAPIGDALGARLNATIAWWHNWCAQCSYSGPYGAAVKRSVLALKLLTYCISGAVVAATTTSLPEGPTGDRNWDYRYCWLRDTSLVLESFLDLGYFGEARGFLAWLLHATRLTQPRLQVLYDVFGETSLTERVVPQLEGYRGIGPVRVGNAAHEQLQLDIYGDVVLTAYDYVTRGGKLDAYEKRLLVGFGRSVRELWRTPDRSIWEIRVPGRQNTYSKLMCWTAIDRLLKLNRRIDLGLDEAAYGKTRDEIRADIEAHGYDGRVQSYVGYYGGSAADASLLLMARCGYIDPRDPRMVSTCRHIEGTLGVNGLLYRYPPGGKYDGVPGGENLFAICSFWLVDYLARAGEVDRAARLYERLLGLANDVGLYAEEFDAKTLAPLGNFPQAFTHVGLITAGLALKQALEGKRGKEIAK